MFQKSMSIPLAEMVAIHELKFLDPMECMPNGWLQLKSIATRSSPMADVQFLTKVINGTRAKYFLAQVKLSRIKRRE